MKYFMLFVFICVVESTRGSGQLGPKVCLKSSCFIGKRETGLQKSYDAFYGIPFAKPPVGKLRFRNPVPVTKWTGKWNSTYPRSECMQRQSDSGSEDCLYMNLYRPINRKKVLPVMVFIHGGSFLFGGADPSLYGPEYFMDNDNVILVTIQYRLGIFGFLSSGDINCHGNFGLKDQNMALKWIKTFVRQFGGDHNSITLFGQSAGAASVHYQVLSPTSNGLFHRAALMSGTALAFWSIIRKPSEQFQQVAQLANIDTSSFSTEEIVNLLRTLPAEAVLELSARVYQFHSSVGAFRPCIEGKWKGAFITNDPELIWETGRYQHRPLLITHTAVEGAFLSDLAFNETIVQGLNANLDVAISMGAEIPITSVGLVKNFYLNNSPISAQNARRLIDLYSDWAFLYPIYKTVSEYVHYANHKKNPVYIAKFDFDSEKSLSNMFFGGQMYLGASHTDDLMYLFTMRRFGMEFDAPSPEFIMSKILVDTFVNFAKTGHIPRRDDLQKCTQIRLYSQFCEYRVFQRFNESEPNTVKISSSNEFDLSMVNVWREVELGSSTLDVRHNR